MYNANVRESERLIIPPGKDGSVLRPMEGRKTSGVAREGE
jgi:hypothetical protein